MTRTIAIIGLGRLGRELALQIALHCQQARRQQPRHDVRFSLVGRNETAGRQFAFFLEACHGLDATSIAVDALDTERLARHLAGARPDVIVQAASMLSPWTLSSRGDPLSQRLLEAGFGLQLPAQLPVAVSVMRASATLSAVPVVNCSFPDVINPILSRMGLCPTVGAGNGGMVEAIVRATLRRRAGASALLPDLRVIAHHAHVTPVVRADPALCRDHARPKVFIGDDGTRDDGLAFLGTRLPADPNLVVLTAAHARAVILALLGLAPSLRTTAPGPRGLPGGYPVKIDEGEVSLELPPGESLDDAVRHNEASALLDGIEHIADDGTVTFTAEARQRLPRSHAELLAPLSPVDALARHALLMRLVGYSA